MDIKRYTDYLKDLENLNNYYDFKKIMLLRTMYFNALNNNSSRQSNTKQRFNPLLNLSEKQFRLKYHFTKDNMRKIIEIIRDDLESDLNTKQRLTNQVPVDLQIMAAIRFWSFTEHPEITAITHNVSYSTLLKICGRVAAAINSKASRYIRMPATLAEKEQITNAFESLAGMNSVIGVVAHSSVQFKTPFLKKKCNKIFGGLLQYQIVCDAYLKIRDLFCVLNMSCKTYKADAIFLKSRIKERFEQNEFRGRFLLGHGQMKCKTYLFPPVDHPITLEQVTYNNSHVKTIEPVNSCLKLWIQRFGILESVIFAKPNVAKHTIVALALLHNMALEWADPSLTEIKQDV